MFPPNLDFLFKKYTESGREQVIYHRVLYSSANSTRKNWQVTVPAEREEVFHGRIPAHSPALQKIPDRFPEVRSSMYQV
jgi:hypothetical protein